MNVTSRQWDHEWADPCTERNQKLRTWKQELRAQGMRPKFVVVASAQTREELNTLEVELIALVRKKGRLYNVHRGGALRKKNALERRSLDDLAGMLVKDAPESLRGAAYQRVTRYFGGAAKRLLSDDGRVRDPRVPQLTRLAAVKFVGNCGYVGPGQGAPRRSDLNELLADEVREALLLLKGGCSPTQIVRQVLGDDAPEAHVRHLLYRLNKRLKRESRKQTKRVSAAWRRSELGQELVARTQRPIEVQVRRIAVEARA